MGKETFNIEEITGGDPKPVSFVPNEMYGFTYMGICLHSTIPSEILFPILIRAKGEDLNKLNAWCASYISKSITESQNMVPVEGKKGTYSPDGFTKIPPSEDGIDK